MFVVLHITDSECVVIPAHLHRQTLGGGCAPPTRVNTLRSPILHDQAVNELRVVVGVTFVEASADLA